MIEETEQFYHNQIKIILDFTGSLKISGSDPCPDPAELELRFLTQVNEVKEAGEQSLH